MKAFKVFLIIVISLLLSGCYTQLQYSQKMKKITDEEKGKVYSWNDEEETEEVDEPVTKEEKYTGYDEDYIPMYYKDYDYAEKCACIPYNVTNYYGNDWYGHGYYPYLSVSPSSFYRWHHPYYYRHRFYPRFAFSFSWGWGSPYYYRYYDPFYDPFYDYYWYGYRPYAFGFRYYYNGYGYYYDRKDRIDRNVRYGPRSIGTNRVVTNGERSRTNSSVTGRSRKSVPSKSTVRTRSARTRSTSDKGTVRTRTRSSSGNDSGTSRSRSRDNFQSDNQSHPDINRSQRTVNINDADRLREELSEQYLRSRIQTWDDSDTDLNRTNRSRPTFFKRMKNFFEGSTGRIINSDRIRSNSTVRSRSTSSPSRSTVSRSKSSSRSSVTRSRSSTGHSRSSGSSSRSRNSSGGSSGSSRSRGN